MKIAAAVFRYLPLNAVQKKRAKYLFFKAAALLRLRQTPSLGQLDVKIMGYLPRKGGVFVEAGANDGVTQSNTWFYEQYRGWSGLLVEPVPYLAALATAARRAPVANVALGPVDGGVIQLFESDLTTTTISERSETETNVIEVPVRALSSLLDEYDISHIDLFSLDVEGFELDVLSGLDFSRHSPRAILVETAHPEKVAAALGPMYRLEATLSVHDYLFLRSSNR